MVEGAKAKGIVIGLSGGVDSSVVATLCVQALGKDKVLGVFLPLAFTPAQDMADARELADWLGGRLIQSDWRPVVLKEGVFFHNMITFNDSSTKKITGEAKQALELLVEDSLRGGGQTLIFVNNRKSTVSLAARLSCKVADLLSEAEKKELKKTCCFNETRRRYLSTIFTIQWRYCK
jgi:hypothetical protein